MRRPSFGKLTKPSYVRPVEEQLAEFLYEKSKHMSDKEYLAIMSLCSICHDNRKVVNSTTPNRICHVKWNKFKRSARQTLRSFTKALQRLLAVLEVRVQMYESNSSVASDE